MYRTKQLIMTFFQILEKYLIDKNGGHIFVESKALAPKEKLSEKTRRQLVNHLVDFMRHVYGIKITAEHEIATAKAAIILFPCMEFENSAIGGIVSLVSSPSRIFSIVIHFIFSS